LSTDSGLNALLESGKMAGVVDPNEYQTMQTALDVTFRW
jgi:hypothetical protein